MSDRLTRSLLGDAYTHLRREGPRATLKAGLRRLNISYEGYYYYANYKYKRLQGRNCVDESDLFRTLTVDPDSIVYLPTRRFDKWNNMGEIREGDWDQPDGKFDDRELVQALRARFKDGREWDDLEYVSRALETVRAGGSTWNGCRSVEDVHDRCKNLDRLYEMIRDRGFQSQTALHGTDSKSLLLSGSFDRSRTDIAVHIARSGEFRFVDGNHRLAISKILNLDEVPVRIVVRHEQWQAHREAIKRTSERAQLPDCVDQHHSHPDLKHLW